MTRSRTGPKTSAGKARSARNALRYHYARRIAAAQLDLAQVRRARRDVLSDAGGGHAKTVDYLRLVKRLAALDRYERRALDVQEVLEHTSALLARISGTLQPADVLEDIWVRDVVDLAWEIMRLRRQSVRFAARYGEPVRRPASAEASKLSPWRRVAIRSFDLAREE